MHSTTAQADANAVEEVLEDLQTNDLLPDELLVDTAYASDDNVQLAEEQGVELVGPVPPGSGKSNDDEYEQLNISVLMKQPKRLSAARPAINHRVQNII